MVLKCGITNPALATLFRFSPCSGAIAMQRGPNSQSGILLIPNKKLLGRKNTGFRMKRVPGKPKPYDGRYLPVFFAPNERRF